MIDWTKDVQMYLSSNEWEDVTILCQPIDGYVWLRRNKAVSPSTYSIAITEFRNKPAEPKRVQGWLCLMKHNDAGTYHIRSFLHDTYDSARECINAGHPYATCVAVFEIDVPEGHGLEERK